MTRTIRIGGASGAWGDSPMAVSQLLDAGVDVLMMDFLAEVTMSLLARARLKNPQAGFPPDVITYLKPHLVRVAERGVKIVTNGGGVNPLACKSALEEACKGLGLSLRIAAIVGDDISSMAPVLREEGVREWISQDELPPELLTANAYLGALPIVKALDAGADIVITGRCADSALALGVLMHEFGWSHQDHDLLAAGSLVGHLLECGPQATGGVFTDWEQVSGWHNIGYPIAECHADGRFVLTKPEGTGGLVSSQTLAEQLLYEVGDPAAYVLPDVVADFTGVTLNQVAPHRVEVTGAKGYPPTAQYKISATWQDGFRAVVLICIIGPQAVLKAERTAHELLLRVRAHLRSHAWPDFSATHVEVLGGEASYGAQSRARDSREVVLRLVAEHSSTKALELLAREVGSVGLGFAPGTAALIGGRPKPAPVVRLFTFLLDKSRLPAPEVVLGADPPLTVVMPVPSPGQGAMPTARSEQSGNVAADAEGMVEVPLLKIAHARSGDKGDFSNVAILCREPCHFEHLKAVLTSERMAAHFADVVEGPVQRYVLPSLNALNFLMHRALGGGGMSSRRIDAQGKAYGQRALEMRIPVPANWLNHQGDLSL